MLEAGQVIAERYRLERGIGEGGMGAVWSATHLTLDSPVALKFIDCRGPRAAQMADRFMREAKVCAAIRHRNVVQIMDFGQCDEGPYMVMELLEGRTPRISRARFSPAVSVLFIIVAWQPAEKLRIRSSTSTS